MPGAGQPDARREMGRRPFKLRKFPKSWQRFDEQSPLDQSVKMWRIRKTGCKPAGWEEIANTSLNAERHR